MKRKVERAMFGKVTMFRATCTECGRTSLIVDGKTACCGARPVRSDEYTSKRESAGESSRKRFKRSDTLDAMYRQGNRCAYCGIELFPGQRCWNNKKCKYVSAETEYDHFIPWSYLGKTDGTILIASCEICNRIKSSKIFDSFAESKRYIRQKREQKGYDNFDDFEFSFPSSVF